MISKREKKALSKAISNESRAAISPMRKNFLLAGFVAMALGAVILIFVASLGKLGASILMLGFIVLVFTESTTPPPSRYDDENFRHKVLGVSTLEMLSKVLDSESFKLLESRKNADSEKCLRVADLFYLLKLASDEEDSVSRKNAADVQQVVLDRILNK